MKRHSVVWMLIVLGFALLVRGSVEDGLVAWFPFEGSAADATGNGNDGLVHGAVLAADRFGRPDGAYLFDGVDDWIDVGNLPVLDIGAGDLTVSAWVWTESTSAQQVFQRFDGHCGWMCVDQHDYYELMLENGFRLNLRMKHDCVTDNFDAVPPPPLLPGEWHLVTGVKAAGALSLYVDGALVQTKARIASVNPLTPGMSTVIGRNNWCNSEGYFCGRLDDVRVYNRALSEAEIQSLFNSPPVADAGPDQEVPAGPDCLTAVTLDGTGSYDPDGDVLQYAWSGPFGERSGATANVVLPVGIHEITLTVSDGLSPAATDTLTVTVTDDAPPVISATSATPDLLWPPNHKLVSVRIDADIFDNCGGTLAWRILGVASNEPEDGLGDGDTGPDWIITGDDSVALRAERSGTGSGRIYSILIEAVDAAGNAAQAIVQVRVPHHR